MMGCDNPASSVETHTHTWGGWEETSPATYTATGVETGTCTVCGQTTTRPIPQIAITSTSELGTVLAGLTDNTIATPYTLRVNLSSETISHHAAALNNNLTKYVFLDMSGSTFTQNIFSFASCTNLTGIILPASVTIIPQTAFSGCSNLASVTVLGNITEIVLYAFYNCSSLVSFTIPASVTKLGVSSFEGCTNLANVTFEGTIPIDNFPLQSPFPGDLRAKFYATDAANGTPGTYTRTPPGTVWTKQN